MVRLRFYDLKGYGTLFLWTEACLREYRIPKKSKFANFSIPFQRKTLLKCKSSFPLSKYWAWDISSTYPRLVWSIGFYKIPIDMSTLRTASYSEPDQHIPLNNFYWKLLSQNPGLHYKVHFLLDYIYKIVC